MKKEFVHEDYKNSKGEIIPSVTQLLNLIGSESLIQWANGLGLRRIPLKVYREEVTLAGSLAHSKIEHFLKNEKCNDDGFYGNKIDNIANLAFERFKVWAEESDIEPIWIERRFTNERYGGTIDLLGRVRKGPIILVDFKTSKKPKPSHLMQLGGYLNLISECEPEMYKQIEFAQVLTLGGEQTRLLTRPIEEMKLYQDAFEKVYLMFCAWKECIIRDNWKGYDLK